MKKFESFTPLMYEHEYKFIEKYLNPYDTLLEWGCGNSSRCPREAILEYRRLHHRGRPRRCPRRSSNTKCSRGDSHHPVRRRRPRRMPNFQNSQSATRLPPQQSGDHATTAMRSRVVLLQGIGTWTCRSA